MTMDKLNNEICELTDAELKVVAGGTVALEHEELHVSASDERLPYMYENRCGCRSP
jgi:hypothetical protein